MRKLLILLLCCLMLLSGCAENPPPEENPDSAPIGEESAEETKTLLVGVIVDSEVVNIRQKPSTDGRILDTARRGEMFEILSQADGWCEVRYRGDIAYISAGLLYQQEWEQDAPLLLGVINAGGLHGNLRAAANTDSAVLLTAMKGEQFIIRQANYSEGWHQVEYKGASAYINADLLDLSETTINLALFP